MIVGGRAALRWQRKAHGNDLAEEINHRLLCVTGRHVADGAG